MTLSKVILVTGTSTGFGRVTAETLARAGYYVFASMRNANGKNAPARDAFLRLAASEKLFLQVIDLDVTSDASVEGAVAEVIERAGHLDVLINNAGTTIIGPTEATTLDQTRQLFETNFFGALRMNRAVLPHMRRRKSGLLIQITSIAGRIAFPLMGMYAASKFALEAMAETYRYELAGLGIDSVIIEPGMYPTESLTKIASDQDAAPQDQARLEAYSALAGHVQGLLGSAMEAVRTHPDAPQPQDIADRILALIKTPAGRRPLRLVVGSLANPFDRNGEELLTVKLNQTAAQVQHNLFEQMNLADVLASKPV